jgi:hypothetical protein
MCGRFWWRRWGWNMTDTYSHYSRTVEYYSRYRPRYPQTLIG